MFSVDIPKTNLTKNRQETIERTDMASSVCDLVVQCE